MVSSRLCILKGIYPREPKNKKKVGRGNAAPNTYYWVKGSSPFLRPSSLTLWPNS